MLDSETKRRIDSARDILVGKVPDPKSQVEQITIALIYKFMDDMDAEAEELGGKRSFFVGEYEKFSWAKLLSPALSGYDMLNLYGESIDKMTRNQGVPQLFRDIFKNAYLPYRDPETLKMFLRVINDFNYDHSEKLGDAFEYLLSVLGSQGDAGQFRTPRHIIDFMVKVLDPQKEDSILDPACGTAGFLISAYKHVMASNVKDGKPGGALKPAERKKLADNIRGYDISPDMVRLSLVNLYLHGFTTPNIFEYDTLSSEENWGQTADVILANPPFMSPKGGIMPHKKFSVQSNRSEVLFVDYMAEHLTPNGRAAIIVPEGIIFQSAGAYKQLRKYLIEHNFLWAVVSLPAGAFNPYAGVKTSILFLDKSLAKKTDKVLFVKVENDGFDLGAQRRKIDKDDLPKTLKVLQSFRTSILDGKAASFALKTDAALLVSISTLEESDYNLSADRYREVIRVGKLSSPVVSMADVCDKISDGSHTIPKGVEHSEYLMLSSKNITNGTITFDEPRYLTEKDFLFEDKRTNLTAGDVLLTIVGALGRTAIVPPGLKNIVLQRSVAVLKVKKEVILPEYLKVVLDGEELQKIIKNRAQGVAQKGLYLGDIAKLPIPLPPLETQRQLVDEIAAHQRVIDGARQVVEGWKPDIEIELSESLSEEVSEWNREKLDNLCEIVRGSSPRPKHDKRFYGGSVPRLMVADITRDGMYVTPAIDTLTEEGARQSRPMKKGDLVMVVSGQPGLCAILNIDACIHDGISGFRNLDQKRVLTEFAYYYLMSQKEMNNSQSVGAIFLNLNNDQLRQFEIPLPPLEIQREIVARIERERAIVHGNRELIRLYEEKVKKVIERVWEG